MFFVKISEIEYINNCTIRHDKRFVLKGLFSFYKISYYSINDDTLVCYLICTQYKQMIIVHSFLVVSFVNDECIYINYIENSNSIIIFMYLNPALLILSIYSIFYCTSISILILEVNSSNLGAFSLYYWFGFQVINRRYNYYKHYLLNTAYTLSNTKFLSKNRLRRYLL